MTTSVKLGLEMLASAAANQTLANTTFAQLDQLVQSGVIDKDLTSPPGSPANGALYIVGAAATGAWSGKSGQLAYWLTTVGAWTFIVPRAGFAVRVLDELDAGGLPVIYGYTGSAWVAQASAGASLPVVATFAGNKTLALSDINTYNASSDATAQTVTLPAQATVAWTADAEIHIQQGAAGAVTITGATGVTINGLSAGSYTLAGVYAVATLKRTSADTWTLVGALEGSDLSGDIVSSLVAAEVPITGAVTLAAGAFGVMHVCSGTTADYTVGLPAASGNSGKIIGLRMSAALTKVVSIDADASELIDGSTVRPMWASEVAILLCDGTGWVKIAGKTIPLQAEIRRVSAQSVPSSTFTDVDFDSIQKDSAGMADLASDRINCKRAGTYQVRGRGVYPDPSGSTTVGITRQVRIHKNGAYLDNAFPDYGQRIPVVNSPISLAAGDYVGINLYQANGVAENVANIFLLVLEVPTW